ncbi:Uncharacterised protein [Yersinia intermedia]|uniref:hypothetical protein n=1 Tax=Yersinia intermedia TaxID=631 RepID=UPI0005DFEFAF|nr:hypothetical protein [Yersinia intermedia]CNJ80122.1 Uncharacterised protein [Yersinia intermedia]
MASLVIKSLCVTVIYRVGAELKTFKSQITPPLLIDRFLQLEMGHVDGLFIPVGNGRQVNAKNVEWFEIMRPQPDCKCPDQFIEYQL